MFLAPPHLFQGLLETPGGSACQLLNQAGLSAAAADAVLVDPELLPQNSSIRRGELHWAPDAQAALDKAAAAAQEAGKLSTVVLFWYEQHRQCFAEFQVVRRVHHAWHVRF